MVSLHVLHDRMRFSLDGDGAIDYLALESNSLGWDDYSFGLATCLDAVDVLNA